MRCSVNIILPTIRFLPVSKDIMTHLFRTGEINHNVHVTIADGQEDEEKKAWILGMADHLLKAGRFTYIGMKDPTERLCRAAQLETEWVLPISDDDPYSVNYCRCLCEAAHAASTDTTAIVPHAYLYYSSNQTGLYRLQSIDEPDQLGRLRSLFKQGQNGLLTWGIMRRRLFLDWMDFVKTKPMWPSYSDQLLVAYLAMTGRFLPTREECLYMKDESDWHDLRRAVVKDSRGYQRPCMTFGHEIFLAADLFSFLRAQGLEDAAVPSLTYRAKELLKSGLVYHQVRLKVLDIAQGTYSMRAYSLISQLLDQAMSLADEDLNGQIGLFQHIESAADQLKKMEDAPLPVSPGSHNSDDNRVTLMPKQRQRVSTAQTTRRDRSRVLLVAHGFPPKQVAGTELYTLALARELQRRGHEVRVVCPAFDEAEPVGAVREEQYDSIAVSHLHLSTPKTLDDLYFNQSAEEVFRSYLQHNRPDLVHFQHLIGFTASVLGACKQLNVPSVMTLHDSWFLCEQWHYMLPDGEFCTGPETVDKCVQCMLARHPGSPIQRQVPHVYYQLAKRRETMRAAILQVDTLIVLTEFQRRNLEQYGFLHPKTVVAPIGLELPQEVSRTRGDGRLRILYLGHIAKRKGLDVLMRAFSRLPKDQVRLDIYGAVIDRAYFQQVMRMAGEGDNAIFHGSYTKADLPRILSACDVAVIPSRAEFYPTTVRECLAAKVPVIASSVGGVPEIIEDGRTGMLFRSGDDADLENKIRQCISDPNIVEQLRACITPVHAIAQDVDRLEQIYESLVERPSAESHREPAKDAHHVGARDMVSEDDASGAFDCSIIIPVHNNGELTKQCLTALSKIPQDIEYEVIVVDNDSTDGTPEFLASLGCDVQIIRNRENLGFAKACNQGAQAARGTYLVFLGNEIIPQDGWLRALVGEVETHPEVGAVGSKLLYRDGTVQHAGVVFSRLELSPYRMYHHAASDLPGVNVRREFQAVAGACLLIRRTLFEELGRFDEGFQDGFEDVDLCLKVREKGYRVVYQPRSVLCSPESRPSGRTRHDGSDATRFRERWGAHWWLADEDLHYHADGYKLIGNAATGESERDLQLLEGIKERAAWAHVAAAQAAAHKQDWSGLKHELGLVQDWPRDPSVLSWAAMVCEKLGEPILQQSFLVRYLDLNESPAVRLSLARALLTQKHLAEAERHLRMLLANCPAHAEGLLLRGVLCMQREQYREAEASFSLAMQQGANRKKCLMGMGMASLGRAYAQGAWEQFLLVLTEHPDDAEAVHWLLRAGTAQNRWAELSDCLRQYVSRNPGDLAVRFALAGVLVRAERIDEARREHDALQAIAPEYDGLAELGRAIVGKEAVLAMETAGMENDQRSRTVESPVKVAFTCGGMDTWHEKG